MSIGSIASTIWTPPSPSQSEINAAWGGLSALPDDLTTSASATSTTTGQTSAVSPFQQLAADIQAMLVQAQGGTTSATTSTTTTTTTTTDPEQQLATDLQTIMGQLQGSQTGGTESASLQQGGQAQGHHHHHHHHEATDASAGTEASAATGTSTSGSNQAVAQVFAADIMQALQFYGDTSASALPA